MVSLRGTPSVSRLGRMFIARPNGGLWHFWGSGFGRLLNQRRHRRRTTLPNGLAPLQAPTLQRTRYVEVRVARRTPRDAGRSIPVPTATMSDPQQASLHKWGVRLPRRTGRECDHVSHACARGWLYRYQPNINELALAHGVRARSGLS
jgi:hypothetical protein